MYIFSKSAIEERRRSSKPNNRVPLRVTEQALAFLPFLNAPELQPAPAANPKGSKNIIPQKAVSTGRKPLKPLTLPGSKPLLGQYVVGMQARRNSEEASTLMTAENLLREPINSATVPGAIAIPSSSESESDGLDYHIFLKCNSEEPDDTELVAKRRLVRKSSSPKRRFISRDLGPNIDDLGEWLSPSLAPPAVEPWTCDKSTRTMCKVVKALLKLHRNVSREDVDIINNMAILKPESRLKSPYPNNFVVWLRGNRIYDLEADRGTLEEFIQDCAISNVTDFNRPDVRNRRAAQALAPFPYAPGETTRQQETASVDE
jgi:hypothetical protein